MINYVASKYGRDHVAQIITFSQIRKSCSTRCRVLDKPHAVGDQIAKAIPPPVMGRDTPLWACLTKTDLTEGFKAASEIRHMYENDPVVKEVIDVALGLEGLRRQDSHSCSWGGYHQGTFNGISSNTKKARDKDIKETLVVTQYEMQSVEDLGH